MKIFKTEKYKFDISWENPYLYNFIAFSIWTWFIYKWNERVHRGKSIGFRFFGLEFSLDIKQIKTTVKE